MLFALRVSKTWSYDVCTYVPVMICFWEHECIMCYLKLFEGIYKCYEMWALLSIVYVCMKNHVIDVLICELKFVHVYECVQESELYAWCMKNDFWYACWIAWLWKVNLAYALIKVISEYWNDSWIVITAMSSACMISEITLHKA